jgi:hypothetical protein
MNLARALTALAAVAFGMAIATNFVGIFLTTAEGWSRAGMNLALLALALVACFGDRTG